MLQKTNPAPVSDPDLVLQGRCGSCGAGVVVTRAGASPPLAPGAAAGPAGVWHDLWATGCGRCGARVYLTPQAADERPAPG